MASMRKERMKKPRKLHSWLKKEIIGFIEQDWSPQQIEGRLKLENKPSVSHETIYKVIRKDKADGGTLYKHTRHQLKYRKRPVGKKIAIKNRVSIDQRPEIVDTKQRFGDWEIDTIVGENNKGAIVTMVERKTAFKLAESLIFPCSVVLCTCLPLLTCSSHKIYDWLRFHSFCGNSSGI